MFTSTMSKGAFYFISKRMKKSGFTLIEMLIVVVIIGILASALLPRLQGYMAKTRDLKRQADLRNIAAAIQMYRNDYGEFPKRNKIRYVAPYVGSASDLTGLTEYLAEIPKDPNKKQMIKIHAWPLFGPSEPGAQKGWGKGWGGGDVLMPGEYLYQPIKISRTSISNRIAALVAKVETPVAANYMINLSIPWGLSKLVSGGAWPAEFSDKETMGLLLEDIHFCQSWEKVSKPEQRVYPTAENAACKYYSEDDLFYVEIVR